SFSGKAPRIGRYSLDQDSTGVGAGTRQSARRLGVKARAAGIFLIFAAQRPDSHVMPMQLRSNLGNRLVLRVASEATSEIALGGERGRSAYWAAVTWWQNWKAIRV